MLQVVEQRLEHYSGPIPHPDVLAKYGEIVPNMPERLLAKFEQQADHRMALERLVIAGDVKRANWGLVSAVVFGLCVLASAVVLVMNGHEGIGAAMMITGFLTYGGAFLYTKRSRRSDREAKH